MVVRRLVCMLAMWFVAFAVVGAEPSVGTAEWPHPAYRLWDDSPEALVRPVDRHPFASPPPLHLSFPPRVFGLTPIRTAILNTGACDADREEAFYHLALRGKAAPPILIALSTSGILERKWELVLVSMMAGVMDRRMVEPLIHYVRHGSTPQVRSVAMRGLARQLGNRALYSVSKAIGPNRMQFRMGGSMTIDTGEISYGCLLLPGDEKPIIRLYEELRFSPEPAVRDQAKGLEWATRDVLAEQKRFQDEGFEIPWGSNGLEPRGAMPATP